MLPATKFSGLASKFKSSITVIVKNRNANGKSVLELLSICAAHGEQVRIEADGEDAEEAVMQLRDLIDSSFGGID